MPLSVLLADHSEAVRKAVVDLLKIDPEIEVVAECDSYGQTMEIAATCRSVFGACTFPGKPPQVDMVGPSQAS